MEQIILNILEALRRGETVDDKVLVKLIHAEARREGADKRDLAKRRLLPFYQRVKREEPARWAAWNVDSDLERQLLQVLRMKPRRTASGVATITVIMHGRSVHAPASSPSARRPPWDPVPSWARQGSTETDHGSAPP